MIACENLGDAWLEGSRRQGRFHATEDDLIEMFGHPNASGEWTLRFLMPTGDVVRATIYPSFVDHAGRNVQYGTWDIGGYSQQAVSLVGHYLSGQLIEEVA